MINRSTISLAPFRNSAGEEMHELVIDNDEGTVVSRVTRMELIELLVIIDRYI